MSENANLAISPTHQFNNDSVTLLRVFIWSHTPGVEPYTTCHIVQIACKRYNMHKLKNKAEQMQSWVEGQKDFRFWHWYIFLRNTQQYTRTTVLTVKDNHQSAVSYFKYTFSMIFQERNFLFKWKSSESANLRQVLIHEGDVGNDTVRWMKT